MKYCTLLLFVLLFAHSSFCKNNTVWAVHYNAKGIPYIIEQKQINHQGVAYLIHDNKNSNYVKKSTTIRGDTLITETKEYKIITTPYQFELCQTCEIWVVSLHENGEYINFQGKTLEDHFLGNDILTCDTMFVGEEVMQLDEFLENIKQIRVPLILQETISVPTDSLLLLNTVVSYFVKNIPLKTEIFNANDSKIIEWQSSIENNRIICYSYDSDKDKKLYKIDTLTFLEASTKIRTSRTRLSGEETYTTEFKIAGNVVQIIVNDSVKKEIEYTIDSKNIFDFLIKSIIRDEPLDNVAFESTDSIQILRVTTPNLTKTYTYENDNVGRTISQSIFHNEALHKKIIYKYED